jgi:hypothetical protein
LFYQELVNNGIANVKEGQEEYSWQDVTSVMTHYKEELPELVAESLLDTLPNKGKMLVDYIFTKGENLSDDDLQKFYSEYLQDLSKENTTVDLSTVESSREFLGEEYKALGFRKSQIEAMLDALEDEEEGGKSLLDEAKKVNEKRMNEKQSSKLLEDSKQEKAERKADQKRFTEEVINELKNTGWATTVINQVMSDLSSNKTWDTMKEITNNPKGLGQLANIIRYYDPKTNTFNLESFVKSIESKDVKSLKDKIKQDMFKTGSSESKSAGRKFRLNNLDSLRPVL